MRSVIKGLGVAVPSEVLTNEDLEKMLDTTDEWITQRTGIKRRYKAPPDVATSDLGAEACRRALEDAGVDKEEVELLICATASPDTPLPSTACWMQPKLGIPGVPVFDVSAACSGFLYGVTVADQFVRAGTYKNVLVVGAEILSRIANWNDRSTCVLVGDGAGAVLVSRGDDSDTRGIWGSRLHADGTFAEFLWTPAGGTVRPATHETVEQGLHGFTMKGNELFKVAVRHMAGVVFELLDDLGVGPEEIDWIVPHQANVRILQSLAKRLRVPWERVVVTIDHYGNTSAASIPLALHEAIEDGRIKRGHKVLFVSFGGGLTWGALLVEW